MLEKEVRAFALESSGGPSFLKLEKIMEYIQQLETKIWKTKGARFNAYRRLMKRNQLSFQATSWMSLYVIFLALAPSLLPAGMVKINSAFISIVTAFMAVAILIISLLEYAKSYELHADRLHRNAMELSALHDELNTVLARQSNNEIIVDEVEKINIQYHKILQSIPENHEPSDYDLFQAQHWEHFKLNKRTAIVIKIREFIHTGLWYYVAIIGPPVGLLIWMIFYI